MPNTIDKIKSELDVIASNHPVAVISPKGLVIESNEVGAGMSGFISLDPSNFPDEATRQEFLAEIEKIKSEGQVVRYGFMVMVDELPGYVTHPELALQPERANG